MYDVIKMYPLNDIRKVRKNIFDAQVYEGCMVGVEEMVERSLASRFDVMNIDPNKKFNPSERKINSRVVEIIKSRLMRNETKVETVDDAFNSLHKSGMPDLLVWNIEKSDLFFIECKNPSDGLRMNQMEWAYEYNYFDVYIAYKYRKANLDGLEKDMKSLKLGDEDE